MERPVNNRECIYQIFDPQMVQCKFEVRKGKYFYKIANELIDAFRNTMVK